MGERPYKQTIDRKDVNKGYYKSNCRWATSIQQTCNKTNTVYVTYHFHKVSLALLCIKLDKEYKTVYRRLYKQNYSLNEALTY